MPVWKVLYHICVSLISFISFVTFIVWFIVLVSCSLGLPLFPKDLFLCYSSLFPSSTLAFAFSLHPRSPFKPSPLPPPSAPFLGLPLASWPRPSPNFRHAIPPRHISFEHVTSDATGKRSLIVWRWWGYYQRAGHEGSWGRGAQAWGRSCRRWDEEGRSLGRGGWERTADDMD